MTTEQAWFTDEDSIENEEVAEGANEEKETPDSPPEKPDETEAPAEETKQTEDDLPFHKHPRFKAITSENRELKQQIEELNQFRQSIESQMKPAEDATKVPEWFATAFGDNPEAYKALEQFESTRLASLKEQVKQELAAEKNEKKEQDNAIKTFIDGEIATLKDEGNTFDANELKKVVLDNKLFDDAGRLNFRAGLAILKATKVDKVEAKKEIASRTAPGNGGSPMKSEVTSATELRKFSSALDFLKRQ